MTRDGELVRVGAKGLRSNELRYVAAELEEADADEALAWLAGEYLRAFGPIRAKDFMWWAGVTASRAKQALAAHDTEELDGGLLILAEDRKAFEKATKPQGVDLLPKWDSYTMGYAPDGRDRFAHPDVVKQCYDFRGDGRPVILVDGQAAGTWEKGEVDLFDKATAKRPQGDRRAARRRQGVPGRVAAQRSISSHARARASCAAIQRATAATGARGERRAPAAPPAAPRAACRTAAAAARRAPPSRPARRSRPCRRRPGRRPPGSRTTARASASRGRRG